MPLHARGAVHARPRRPGTAPRASAIGCLDARHPRLRLRPAQPHVQALAGRVDAARRVGTSTLGFAAVTRMRVLVLAESCNPEWISLPLVGWSHVRALHDLVDVHLVTQAHNREGISRSDFPPERVTYIE